MNTNQNFSNVTFNITDGELTVKPLENVTVTITEHSNSDEIVYDGEEHTVTGYDVDIDPEPIRWSWSLGTSRTPTRTSAM